MIRMASSAAFFALPIPTRNRVEGIDPTQGADVERQSDDRQVGQRRDGTRKRSREACARDHDLVALLFRSPGQFSSAVRIPMSGGNDEVVSDAGLVQHSERAGHAIAVTLRADEDQDFLGCHGALLRVSMNGSLPRNRVLYRSTRTV
jgi:hypothetical protein